MLPAIAAIGLHCNSFQDFATTCEIIQSQSNVTSSILLNAQPIVNELNDRPFICCAAVSSKNSNKRVDLFLVAGIRLWQA